MARLTDLLGNRELVKEQQLERGRIFVFSEGNMYTSFCNCVCWRPPGVGCVVIDVWGASGSGAKMCCCGSGIPGNPGSFARKCICVCPDINYLVITLVVCDESHIIVIHYFINLSISIINHYFFSIRYHNII